MECACIAAESLAFRVNIPGRIQKIFEQLAKAAP
jgi:hypothetical protein